VRQAPPEVCPAPKDGQGAIRRGPTRERRIFFLDNHFDFGLRCFRVHEAFEEMGV
jgi:hypothetical protein